MLRDLTIDRGVYSTKRCARSRAIDEWSDDSEAPELTIVLPEKLRKIEKNRDFSEKRDLWLSEKRWRKVVGVKKMRLATLNKMSYCSKLYDARGARTSSPK